MSDHGRDAAAAGAGVCGGCYESCEVDGGGRAARTAAAMREEVEGKLQQRTMVVAPWVRARRGLER